MTVNGTTVTGAAVVERPVDVEPGGSEPAAVALPLPGLGTVELSRPEVVYVAGIAGLAVAGLVEWPIALVMATGHVLAADRSAKTLRALGRRLARA